VQYIINTNDKNNAIKSEYTQRMVKRLRAKHPQKNVIVYHNKVGSKFTVANGAHFHEELGLIGVETMGYEVWVFDSGHFKRHGDGGYNNWAYSGKYTASDDGKTVDFQKM